MAEDAAESRKRKEHEDDAGEGPTARSVKIPAIFDGEEEMFEEIEEADLAEFMKLLEDELTTSSSSSSSPGTSFVTINGNEESCGPSFSVSASTVMASVDTRDSRCGPPYFVGWAAACSAALRPAAPFIWPWPCGSMPESGSSEGSAVGDAKPEEVAVCVGEVEGWMARDSGVVGEVGGGASWDLRERRGCLAVGDEK